MPTVGICARLLDLDWADEDAYLARLTKRARRFQREAVAPRRDDWEARVLFAGDPTPPRAEWAHLYGLYHNVWERSFHLNTFALPEDLLPRMLEHPGWEIVTLSLGPDAGGDADALPQAFFAARLGPEQYVPVVVGLAGGVGPEQQSMRWRPDLPVGWCCRV